MFNVKSSETNDDQKLYQNQMLLSESKFNLQFINIVNCNQSDAEITSKAEKEELTISECIRVNNLTNKLCIDICITLKQNRKTCQNFDLNNCQVHDEVL